MKLLLTSALGALCLMSCTSRDKDYNSTDNAVGTTPASAQLDVPDIDSQDEADASAAKSISKDNADAEFEKLKKELSGG
jgi:hypothetical protein